jgi:hypothetical protein
MNSIDKSKINDIVKIDKRNKGFYRITFSDGKKEIHRLGKQGIKELKNLIKSNLTAKDAQNGAVNNIINDAPQNKVELANETTDKRFNLGLNPARIDISERKVGKKTWQPASVTYIEGENPDYVYRLVNTEKPGNVHKKMAEKWENCTEETVNLPSRTIHDGTQIGSGKQIRELLLMRMPKNTKKARDEYMESQQIGGKELEAMMKAKVGETAYGKIEKSQG